MVVLYLRHHDVATTVPRVCVVLAVVPYHSSTCVRGSRCGPLPQYHVCAWLSLWSLTTSGVFTTVPRVCVALAVVPWDTVPRFAWLLRCPLAGSCEFPSQASRPLRPTFCVAFAEALAVVPWDELLCWV